MANVAKNGKKEGKGREFQLIPNLPAKLGRIYSNFVEISHSPWDFTLRFCDAPPGSDLHKLKTGESDKIGIPTTVEVVIPVNLMSGLIDALRTQNEKYLEVYQPKKLDEKDNKKRVKEILKDINDKDSFTIELISAVNNSIARKDSTLIKECLDEWEVSAELNRIPGFSKKVCNRYNSLVKAGLIK